MRRYYRRKVYICNEYTDVSIYPVYPKQGGRGRKRKPTAETQARLNTENSKRKLLRIVHTNFSNDDYFLTLTYDEKHLPQDIDSAKRDMQNFLRRLKRLYKKNGIELKYIWLVESGTKSGRIHFHMFLSGKADRTDIELLWHKGYINTRALQFNEEGVAALVYYVTKNKPLLYKRWSGSRNLKNPIERENDFIVSGRCARNLYESILCDDMRQIKSTYPCWKSEFGKYEISGAQAQKNEVNGEFYISLHLYSKNLVFRR